MPQEPSEGTLDIQPTALVGGAAETPAESVGVKTRYMVGSVLLSLAVLAVIGYVTFDPQAFGQFAQHLNVWLLIAAVGTVVVRVLFGALRLRHFSHGQLPLGPSVRYQIVWDFLAYVTPSTVGGGPLLPVFIAREGHLKIGDASSVVLFSMLVDQIIFALTIPALLLAALAIPVFPQVLGTAGSVAMGLFFVGYLAWVGLLAYGTLLRPDHLGRFVAWVFRLPLLRRVRDRAISAVANMEERAHVLRSESFGFYAKGVALSIVPWVARYLLAVFVIWSVHPGVEKLLVFARSAALQLGSLAVPTPGGAGGVEGLYVLFLGPPLQPEALVAPTLFVWRLLSYYAFIGVGFVLVARHLRRRRVDAEPIAASPPPATPSTAPVHL